MIHRAVRPVVRGLRDTGLSPNQITAARITTAVAAAACFACARPQVLRLGCLLFAVSAVLDRMDGELARQTGRFSAWGHRLDLVADCTSEALAFWALGIGSLSSPLGPWALLLGLSAGFAVLALFWQLNIRQGGRSLRSATHLFDPDDAVFLIPLLLIILGSPEVVLIAGLFTPIVAITAIWRRSTL